MQITIRCECGNEEKEVDLKEGYLSNFTVREYYEVIELKCDKCGKIETI